MQNETNPNIILIQKAKVYSSVQFISVQFSSVYFFVPNGQFGCRQDHITDTTYQAAVHTHRYARVKLIS